MIVVAAVTVVAVVARWLMVVMVMVVATDKHITLLFKTRSGIKHNAESDAQTFLHAPPFVSTDCS